MIYIFEIQQKIHGSDVLYRFYVLRPLHLAIAPKPYLCPRTDVSNGRIKKIDSSIDFSWQTIAKIFYAKNLSCGRNACKFSKFATMTHNTVCTYLILHICLKTFVCAESAFEDDSCSHL